MHCLYYIIFIHLICGENFPTSKKVISLTCVHIFWWPFSNSRRSAVTRCLSVSTAVVSSIPIRGNDEFLAPVTRQSAILSYAIHHSALLHAGYRIWSKKKQFKTKHFLQNYFLFSYRLFYVHYLLLQSRSSYVTWTVY